MKNKQLVRILLGGLCASMSLWLPSPSIAQDKPIAAPAGSGTTSKPATTTETSVKQESITGAQKTFPSATPEAVIAVTRRIFPAVVRLDVAQEIYSEGKRNVRRGIGSGVIIDAEGRILTNYHVAGRAAEIFVTLANKERIRGKLGRDAQATRRAPLSSSPLG